MLETLSNTVSQNQAMMNSLSKRSISLSNSIVPRNALKPDKQAKLPGHPLYSYRKVDHASARLEFQRKLKQRLSNMNGASSIESNSYRNMP